MGCAIGMIACLPFLGQLASSLAAAPVSAVLGIVYLGLVPTAVGFSAWAYALQRTTAGRLSVSTYIVPAIAIVLALIFFREVPAPLAIVGGVICLAGVAISRRRGRVRPAAGSPAPSVTVPRENLPE